VCEGGRVEPITAVTDNSDPSEFSVSVTVASELVENFVQKLQQIDDHLALKQRTVYVYG